MKTRRKKSPSAPRGRRFSIIAVTTAVVIVAIAGITVLSKQIANRQVARAADSSTTAGRKYVTVKVAGREVQVDPQTGQIKPMTPEKAQEMADLLKARLNKSTDDLPQIQNPDGSVSVDLKGRAQNVVLARRNADGAVESSCVDEPLAAAEFLGIDPQLVGAGAKRANGQAITKTPAKKANQ